jgi:hypothetical protein
MHNIFISHAWHRSEHYKKVIEWLDDSDIEYRNYSVPEENPLHSGNKTKLKEDLTDQIRPAGKILILAGMYAAHSDWIEYEINEAVRMGKYIVGIKPWGQERVPTIIQDNATVMVGWNASSVIDAIKNTT